jgi:hypothetical protein
VAGVTGPGPGPGPRARPPERSTLAKLWPPLIMVVVTVAGWALLLPWNWSTVDAAGRRTDRGNVWSGLFFLAVVIGLAVAIVVRRYPFAILTAPLTAVVTMAVLYSWRASQARVVGSNAWVFGLIGVVIPLGLLGAFGGAFLAIRSNHTGEPEK